MSGRFFIGRTMRALAVFCTFGVISALSAAEHPKIFFKYSYAFDSVVCKDAIKSAEVTELVEMLPVLQASWDRQQTALFDATARIVGKPFRRKEETAVLYLCRDIPAMATPLLIWGHPFLKTVRGNAALDRTMIGPIVFHEVLHLYVNEILEKRSTPLLDENAKESALVRAHLHSFAIEHEVFMTLDPSGKTLRTVRKMDESYGTDYVRAWSIVTNRGAAPFIKELHER
ncbi:MAG: hypothetical protein AABZ39_15090 [Spirochaetota bacterium]